MRPVTRAFRFRRRKAGLATGGRGWSPRPGQSRDWSARPWEPASGPLVLATLAFGADANARLPQRGAPAADDREVRRSGLPSRSLKRGVFARLIRALGGLRSRCAPAR